MKHNKCDYVYISYAYRDSAFVMPILEKLLNSGYPVHIESGVNPGNNVSMHTTEVLMRSGCVLAFVSKNSLNIDVCRAELMMASAYKHDRLVVINMDNAMILDDELRIKAKWRLDADKFISENALANALCKVDCLRACCLIPEEAFAPRQEEAASYQEEEDNWQETESFVSDQRATEIERTLSSSNIDAKVVNVEHGPAYSRYSLKMTPGMNVNRMNNVVNNLAMALQVSGVRLEIPIPGTDLVGVEVPKELDAVPFRVMLDSEEMRNDSSAVAAALGKDVGNNPVICNLSDMPHLLIAGRAGSGKSKCLDAMIMSIICRATPQQVRLLMIDPMVFDLQPYNGIPHLLTKVVTEPKKAVAALEWLIEEMTERYRQFQQASVRNITAYNAKVQSPQQAMSEIVVFVSELGDLMMEYRRRTEDAIQRLAALARAAGIYMVIATQRPSVDVITGLIKANIPSRIAFAVNNNVESRTIIDSIGAEKLQGRGDMLYYPRSDFRPMRVQGTLVTEEEIHSAVEQLKENVKVSHHERLETYLENAAAERDVPSEEPREKSEDELLEEAVKMAVEDGQTSISMLRRRLGIGHSRAARVIDKMTDMGILARDEGPKPRKTLITSEEYEEMKKQRSEQ